MDLKDLHKRLHLERPAPALEAANAIEQLAWALAMVLDGIQAHDLQAHTGLPQQECDQIESVRAAAAQLTFGN